MAPRFSIIVVCLNPGDKFADTIKSIQMQTCSDYEVIVKDGLSTDGALERFGALSEQFHVIRQQDNGIYDAMNQAVRETTGQYVYFLNCGDRFYTDTVLEKMAEVISAQEKNPNSSWIFYGNIFERVTSQRVSSNPALDDFGCYRNVPCHQACFYKRELLLQHPFETSYLVRADYEQFLWCYFKGNANLRYVDVLVCDYEGGGFSETGKNLKISEKEHQQIVKKYMTKGQILKYRIIMTITLAHFRTFLSRNEKTAGWYNRCKKMLYTGNKGK